MLNRVGEKDEYRRASLHGASPITQFGIQPYQLRIQRRDRLRWLDLTSLAPIHIEKHVHVTLTAFNF